MKDMCNTFSAISTLMCYLELHPKRWIENLQPAYATCILQCYGGPRQLMEVAKKVTILTYMLLKHIFGNFKSDLSYHFYKFLYKLVKEKLLWMTKPILNLIIYSFVIKVSTCGSCHCQGEKTRHLPHTVQ